MKSQNRANQIAAAMSELFKIGCKFTPPAPGKNDAATESRNRLFPRLIFILKQNLDVHDVTATEKEDLENAVEILNYVPAYQSLISEHLEEDNGVR